MIIQYFLIVLTIFGIVLVYLHLSGSNIYPEFLLFIATVYLIVIFIGTFGLKDFVITKERLVVSYTLYKSKIVDLELKDIETLRFDINYNPKRKPKLTIIYLESTQKQKVIEFDICYKYEILVDAIEYLRKNGVHVISTENTEVK